MAEKKTSRSSRSVRRSAAPRISAQTLIGLGLNKMHKVVELQDTPEVRGAIRKLPHMVEIVDD